MDLMEGRVYQKLEMPYDQSASQKTYAKFTGGRDPNLSVNTPTKKRIVNDSGTSNRRRKLLYMVISACALAIIGIVVYFIVIGLRKESNGFTSRPEETDYDLGNDLHILTRRLWGGRDILDGYQNRTLVHPIKLVIIGHTASPQCLTVKSCAQRLQSIQSYHVSDLGYVDIGYNFLVGGEGNLYQALGWDIGNYLRNNSIQIQLIGSYAFDEVLDRQRIGLQALLDHGVKLGKLDEDYLLVPQSHITNTESPGKNLLREMKLWPHYYEDSLPSNI